MPEELPCPVAPLSATELRRLLDLGEPIALLDVREDSERAYCALPAPPGVVDLHVPLNRISGRFAEIAGAASGRPIVVYCHHGVRSLAAARWLSDRGLADLRNLEGGIDAWSRAVDPDVPRY